MPTTLIVTNDFPPRIGGIESFVADLVDLLDGDVVVYTSAAQGSASFDRRLGVEVVRGGAVLLPTSAATREAVGLLRSAGASRVLFGAAAPLGLMAPALRRAGASHILALSHGHETWWATLPVARSLLRRLADGVDHVSTISDFTAGRIAPALSPSARARMIRLAPPVDGTVFRPSGVPSTGRPRVLAVGRLVRQKGFGVLLRAWRLVLREWSSSLTVPELVLVGDGPHRRTLERSVARLGIGSSVRMVGRLPRSQVVAELQRADVFALPVRTRLWGLNPEGLGLAAIEAAACGLPVVIGRSGGAPETVLDGRSGFLVDPDDETEVAARITELLLDPVLARRFGAEGRRFVLSEFGTARARTTLRAALALD